MPCAEFLRENQGAVRGVMQFGGLSRLRVQAGQPQAAFDFAAFVPQGRSDRQRLIGMVAGLAVPARRAGIGVGKRDLSVQFAAPVPARERGCQRVFAMCNGGIEVPGGGKENAQPCTGQRFAAHIPDKPRQLQGVRPP